jgi:hypothetical protein
MKIINDKYYTSVDTAKYCIDKTFEIIGKENITEIIEPSAGNGSFSIQMENCIAYDIEPEHDTIIKQDYLELQETYKKGRLIIGNPPFGVKMNLAQKFFKKSVLMADYIAFILPISQLNNSISIPHFDLIYSEDLGKLNYSDRILHCCFNIYKRPKEVKVKVKSKLNDITITRQDSKNYDNIDFDIRFCYWGNGSAGKVLEINDKKCAGEYKIKINNLQLKDKIVDLFKTFDWRNELKFIAMMRIKQFEIIEVLRKYIPEIK